MKFHDSWCLRKQTIISKKYHAPSLEITIINWLTDFGVIWLRRKVVTFLVLTAVSPASQVIQVISWSR